MKASTQSVALKRLDGSTFELIQASVYGVCAVHRWPALKTWRVTHVPTGTRLADCPTRQQAVTLAQFLGDDPLFADGVLTTATSRAEREPAYVRLQLGLALVGSQK